MTTAVPQGITENDIADYLANTPAFFERHAELLATIQLQSPFGQRAVPDFAAGRAAQHFHLAG